MATPEAIRKPALRVRFSVNDTYGRGGLYIIFGCWLNRRGSSFVIHAHDGYVRHASDSELLSSVIEAVLSPETGVKWVEVTNSTLRIDPNNAESVDKLMMRIVRAAEHAGYVVTLTPSSHSHEDIGRSIN